MHELLPYSTEVIYLADSTLASDWFSDAQRGQKLGLLLTLCSTVAAPATSCQLAAAGQTPGDTATATPPFWYDWLIGWLVGWLID